MMITAGVAALSPAQKLRLIAAVRGFDAFDRDNDPYSEHDFGAVCVDGHRCFWKIDAYHQTFTRHTPSQTNPAVTQLVLTIMLAEEY